MQSTGMSIRNRQSQKFARYRKTGDVKLLAEFFDEVAPELARVAMYLVADRHLAEDIVQSTFLAALTHGDKYESKLPALPWMLGILANQARMARRRRRRTSSLEGNEVCVDADPAEGAARFEIQRSIQTALEQLSPPYRIVLSRHLLYGESAREIAEDLQRPAGTVRTQIVRGMEQVRRKIPRGFLSAPALVMTHPWDLGGIRETSLDSRLQIQPTQRPALVVRRIFNARNHSRNCIRRPSELEGSGHVTQ